MDSARAPVGGAPPLADLGARFSQKREWLMCPLDQILELERVLY